MKIPITNLIAVVFIFSMTSLTAQLNKKVNTGNVLSSKQMDISVAIPIKKINERDYKNLKLSDVNVSKIREITVPMDYLKKTSKKTWKITPDRAFGEGNLGLRFFQGQLSREAFWIERDFVQGRAIFYVATLTFDGKKGNNYLIRIKVNGVSSNSYIYMGGGSSELKVHGQNGSFILLVKAEESGKMSIPLSARHTVGGNERYPDPLLVREIVINEL
jgi:hypothetical protein